MTIMSASEILPGDSCQRGFTLLEVLVALSIIAIVIVSVLRLQGQSVGMNEISRFYTTAPFLAQKKIAEIRTDPQRYMGSESGTFDDTVQGLQWTTSLEPVEIAGEENNLLEMLSATVTIESQTQKSRYVVHSYFHLQGGGQ